MSLWLAAAAAAPLFALFLGVSGHSKRAASAGAAALALWLVALALGPGLVEGATVGVWVVAAAIASWELARLSETEHKRLGAALEDRKMQRAQLVEVVAKLREETARWEEEQQRSLAVYGLVKGLSEVLNWESVRPKLETALEQQLRFDEYSFFVAEPDSGRMFPLLRKRLNNGIGSSWESLEIYWQKSGRDRLLPQIIEDGGVKTMAVPVLHSKEMVGYLTARLNRPTDLNQSLERAAEFTAEIAFALRRVRLFQEVEELSEIDGLTGVYRRHRLDEKLREETARSKVFRTPYCLMLLDIDHFKRLNDTYGHIFGDVVLRRLGEVLKQSVYETDFVARYGGEEFAILLPRAEAEGVLRKGEAIRARIQQEAFTQAMETVHCTMSIGIAHYPRDGQTPEEIVRKADQALYAAKLRGRNRVVDFSQT